MGPMPENKDERELVLERFWKAASQLDSHRLTHRVLVLWQGSPLDAKVGRKAEPLATQYINDKWARKLDPHIQYEVNRTAWRAGTRDAYARAREILKSSQTNYWRLIMVNGWTLERRQRQAALIKTWRT